MNFRKVMNMKMLIKTTFIKKTTLISIYMLPTLGHEKEQQQIKFYKKSLGELIFSQLTKNLKMFYFTRPAGQVLKK